LHRDNPTGKNFKISRAGFGMTLYSSKNQDLTLSQVKAFFKTLKSKNLRKILRKNSQPYFNTTKKPSEVRMGKGHGVKFNKKINPLIIGSKIYTVRMNLRTKSPLLFTKIIALAFRKGLKKLSTNYKITNMDL